MTTNINTGALARPKPFAGTASPGGRPNLCRRVPEQIRKTRAALVAESQAGGKVNPRLLQLTLNEAEALAWETRYPHLVFPTLAAEKIEGLAAWARHQRAVRRNDATMVLAA